MHRTIIQPKSKRNLPLLPTPQLIEHIQGVTYTLYRAKSIYNPLWEHPSLSALTKEIRKSYQHYYGEDIQPIDSYDQKAGVYITKVTNTKRGSTICKWYSVRFVPAANNPISTEDIDFYVYRHGQKKSPILSLLKKKYSDLLGKSPLENIVTISRFCSLSTTNIPEQEQKLYADGSKQEYYAGISFAIMNREFMKDAETAHLPFTLITAQMHLSLIRSLLRLPCQKNGKVLPFQKVSKLIKEEDGKISLNRENPKVYLHRFPGYFLKLIPLVKVLHTLVRKKIMSEQTLIRYLDPSTNIERFFNKPHIRDVRYLGILLHTKGKISGSTLTGKALRTHINETVEDGPILHIMKIHSWFFEIKSMIEKSKQYVQSDNTNYC